nr:unnamed protein product [Spirometra erinaceieuropaei]
MGQDSEGKAPTEDVKPTDREYQPWTIGEANQERHGGKTGSCSAGSRYGPVMESQTRKARTVDWKLWCRHGRKTGSCSAGSRYWPDIETAVGCGEPTVDDWGSQPRKARTEDWKCL